jgi:hypothetical protein
MATGQFGPAYIPGTDTKFSSENDRTQKTLSFPYVLVRFCIIIIISRSSTMYTENLLTIDHTNTTAPITQMGYSKQPWGKEPQIQIKTT